MSRQHVEIIDGQTFTVTRLPRDPRLQPAAKRKRALWNTLTPGVEDRPHPQAQVEEASAQAEVAAVPGVKDNRRRRANAGMWPYPDTNAVRG
jgi:hypothetical protein